MPSQLHDPRDGGSPNQIAWSEFCAAWASSFLMGRLLREAEALSLLRDVAVEWRNVNDEVLDIQAFAEEQGIEPDEEPVPTRAILGDDIPTLTVKQFETLYFAAFHGPSDDRDVHYLLKSSVIAGHHHALEQYFKKVTSWKAAGKLPEAIRDWLRARTGDLPSELWDGLVLLDASRHCLTHNWGRVDEGFLKAVRNPEVLRDEYLPLSERHLLQHARVAWSVAREISKASYK